MFFNLLTSEWCESPKFIFNGSADVDLAPTSASPWQQVCCTGGGQNMFSCFLAYEAPQQPCAGRGEKHRFPPTILHLLHLMFFRWGFLWPLWRISCVIEEDWITCPFSAWLWFYEKAEMFWAKSSAGRSQQLLHSWNWSSLSQLLKVIWCNFLEGI